jgi:hypothetical protein
LRWRVHIQLQSMFWSLLSHTWVVEWPSLWWLTWKCIFLIELHYGSHQKKLHVLFYCRNDSPMHKTTVKFYNATDNFINFITITLPELHRRYALADKAAAEMVFFYPEVVDYKQLQ